LRAASRYVTLPLAQAVFQWFRLNIRPVEPLEWLIEPQMEIPISRGTSISDGARLGVLGLPAHPQRDSHRRRFAHGTANANADASPTHSLLTPLPSTAVPNPTPQTAAGGAAVPAPEPTIEPTHQPEPTAASSRLPLRQDRPSLQYRSRRSYADHDSYCSSKDRRSRLDHRMYPFRRAG